MRQKNPESGGSKSQAMIAAKGWLLVECRVHYCRRSAADMKLIDTNPY